MASIRKQMLVDAPGALVWEAIRDVGALHTRLVPGFVVDTRLDGADRLVTFGNGSVVTERIVSIDDDARRLVWTIVGGRFAHYNGSVEVIGTGGAPSSVVWTTDLLPDDFAGYVASMMEQGLSVMKRTLEAVRGDDAQGTLPHADPG